MSARKKNLVPLFGVAFIVAIISTGVFYGLFVGKLNSASTTGPGGGKVWVAAKPLTAGTVLKADDLREINWPEPPLPAGVISKLEDAAGKTLVEPLAANELVVQSQIASPKGGSLESGSLGIPQGKRAVSLQVQDSAGVVALLKPGHRVDIQVVGVAPGAAFQEPQLRTVLENMQILTIPRDVQRAGSQIVTVLASPREATLLGLADSTAKIRIALRNPVDSKQENPGSVGLSALFRGNGPTPGPANASAGTAAPRTASPVTVATRPVTIQKQVQLLVRVGGANWETMSPHVLDGSNAEGLQVASFRINVPMEKILSGFEPVATSRLTSGKGGEAGLRWSVGDKSAQNPDPSCGMEIQFSPQIEADGRVRIRVQPEVTLPTSSGSNRRRMNTEIDLADGQSFLVRGFAAVQNLPLLWEKLFVPAAKVTEGRDLIVLVTPNIVKKVPGATPASD